MRGDACERKKIIERKVAIADGVEAVRGDSGKTEFARDGVAVDAEGVSGERAGPHGTRIGACCGVLQAGDVPQKSFRMGEQKM